MHRARWACAPVGKRSLDPFLLLCPAARESHVPITADTSRAAATARTPGIDVARAIAVLGMVIVNVQGYLEAEHGPDWLLFACERLEGRAAALFVLLAGIGVSLRSRRARLDPAGHLRFERVALLKRAAVLYGVGLLNLHLWSWDILHCYGAYLALATLLLVARPAWLWASAGATLVATTVLQLWVEYDADIEQWTPLGMAAEMLYSGLYPVIPWFGFVAVGMWLGRQNLRSAAVRHRLLTVALAAAVVGEAASAWADQGFATDALPYEVVALLSSWPRPATATYMVTAGGMAVACICLCISVTERRPAAGWVVALTATGQLAFSHYVAHAIALLIAVRHGLFDQASVTVAVVYSLVFYAGAIVVSVWWRRRWSRGPLETLVQQVTGRMEPAPWGGAPLASAPRSA